MEKLTRGLEVKKDVLSQIISISVDKAAADTNFEYVRRERQNQVKSCRVWVLVYQCIK